MISSKGFCKKLCLWALMIQSVLHAQALSEAILREKIRMEITNHHAPPVSLGTDGERPKHERVLELGQQAGVDGVRMQALLLEFAEEGLLGSLPKTGENWEESGRYPENVAKAQFLAKGALSVLSRIADAAAIPRLLDLAEAAPRNLESAAVRAVALTVCRESPIALPAVARQLTAGREFSHFYSALHDVLKYHIPLGESEQARLTALIADVLKDAVRNPNYGDRIYLDSVLEEYSPGFRTSEERRRILVELSANTNQTVRRYAEEELQSLALVAEMQLEPETSTERPPSTFSSEVHTNPTEVPTVIPRPSHAIVIGGVFVMSVLLWLVWRVASRRQ